MITTTDTKLPITTKGKGDYQLVIAKFDRLPATLKSAALRLTENQAQLVAVTKGQTHYLIVTAKPTPC